MRHAREDYNHIQDPSGKIAEDEPVFLLRGKDKLAPATLEFWAAALEAAGGDYRLCVLAREQAARMRDWQEFNESKLPDL